MRVDELVYKFPYGADFQILKKCLCPFMMFLPLMTKLGYIDAQL